MKRPVKFLHSANFRLGCPLLGLEEIPAPLAGPLAEAPRQAVRRVADAAISERVDFVVLAGGLISLRSAAPEDLVFLNEQFQRLAEADVPVYLAADDDENPADWPSALAPPANVRVFRADAVEHFAPPTSSGAEVCLLGQSHPAAGVWPTQWPTAEWTVAVTSAGEVPVESPHIDYWALGGQSTAEQRRSAGGGIARRCGAPLSRDFSEGETGGCTLVHAESDRVEIRTIETGPVRWREVPVRDAGDGDDSLLTRLRRAASQLAAEAAELTLVRWVVTGEPQSVPAIRRAVERRQWLQTLRDEFGRRNPAVWSTEIALKAEVDGVIWPPDSIGAAFVEELRRLAASAPADGALRVEDSTLVDKETCQRFDSAARRRVLEQAAALGAETLTAQEANA